MSVKTNILKRIVQKVGKSLSSYCLVWYVSRLLSCLLTSWSEAEGAEGPLEQPDSGVVVMVVVVVRVVVVVKVVVVVRVVVVFRVVVVVVIVVMVVMFFIMVGDGGIFFNAICN